MNNISLNRFLLFLLASYFLLSCGYQPVLNKGKQEFTIAKFTLDGNKRLGGLLKNNLIFPKKNKNNLNLNIKSSKNTSIDTKTQTGKILTYAVTLDFEIAASELDGKTIFSKVYTRKKSYAASDVHFRTLQGEKKVVESLIESVANQIQIDLNSVYQNR